jgi:signal transduction histidine kinase
VNPILLVSLIALGCSGAVALAGVALVMLRRRASLRLILVVAVGVGVLALVAAELGTPQLMFVSGHDRGVALTVTLVAGAVALVVAAVLAHQIARDVQILSRTAEVVGTGEPAWPSRRQPRTTELREVQAELERSAERLDLARRRERAIERSRRELVAWVSHDLRTPLAGMRAMAEALEDGVADDPARYHRQIRREVQRLSRMVDDLFELARIESGNLELVLERLDLSDLAGDVVAGVTPVAQARGIRVTTDVNPVAVLGDSAGLGRVLANLMANAIRHTPAAGAVDLQVVRAGNHAVMSVSDACGGLDPAELERVFDVGWRASAARSPIDFEPNGEGGAGLGLAIARGIVTAHRGGISVANTTHGCRFEVRLPVAARPGA